MVELFENLLQRTFEDKSLPQFYIDNATRMILKYTGLSYLNNDFDTPIVLLAVHLFRFNSTVKQTREGEKSVTIFNDTIPPEVKAMLPYPKVKVMG